MSEKTVPYVDVHIKNPFKPEDVEYCNRDVHYFCSYRMSECASNEAIRPCCCHPHNEDEECLVDLAIKVNKEIKGLSV